MDGYALQPREAIMTYPRKKGKREKAKMNCFGKKSYFFPLSEASLSEAELMQ